MPATLPHLIIHRTSLSPELIPVAAASYRGAARSDWWETDAKTAGHARHCQPLAMANTLGWYILSPGEFDVRWKGGGSDVVVESADTGGLRVDNHSAQGSFTLQPGFIPTTCEAGDFLLVKGRPNLRRSWFTVMEALIEAWWQPAPFGLVCLLNYAGEFHVARGEPLAQMAIYRVEGGFATMNVTDELPPLTKAWRKRRRRPGYRKDFDYARGRYPDGTAEQTHIRNWRRLPEFLHPPDSEPTTGQLPPQADNTTAMTRGAWTTEH